MILKKMVVTFPESKENSIIQECTNLYKSTTATIKAVARVIGMMVSSFSAVEYGRLFYRRIENAKIDKGKSKFSIQNDHFT